ncbi:Lon protease [compost metagenome]
MILPRRNERDLEDVPPNLRQEMEFIFADAAEEVVPRALEASAAAPTPAAAGAAAAE